MEGVSPCAEPAFLQFSPHPNKRLFQHRVALHLRTPHHCHCITFGQLKPCIFRSLCRQIPCSAQLRLDSPQNAASLRDLDINESLTKRGWLVHLCFYLPTTVLEPLSYLVTKSVAGGAIRLDPTRRRLQCRSTHSS